jgi:hypothetical protein
MVLIHDESSPTTYRFAMNVPEGGYTKVNSDGSATVYDKDGNAIRQVARPWAFDAAGRPQKTWYTVDENGDLIQHVEPAENALFPIVADPLDMCTVDDMNANGVADAQEGVPPPAYPANVGAETRPNTFGVPIAGPQIADSPGSWEFNKENGLPYEMTQTNPQTGAVYTETGDGNGNIVENQGPAIAAADDPGPYWNEDGTGWIRGDDGQLMPSRRFDDAAGNPVVETTDPITGNKTVLSTGEYGSQVAEVFTSDGEKILREERYDDPLNPSAGTTVRQYDYITDTHQTLNYDAEGHLYNSAYSDKDVNVLLKPGGTIAATLTNPDADYDWEKIAQAIPQQFTENGEDQTIVLNKGDEQLTVSSDGSTVLTNFETDRALHFKPGESEPDRATHADGTDLSFGDGLGDFAEGAWDGARSLVGVGPHGTWDTWKAMGSGLGDIIMYLPNSMSDGMHNSINIGTPRVYNHPNRENILLEALTGVNPNYLSTAPAYAWGMLAGAGAVAAIPGAGGAVAKAVQSGIRAGRGATIVGRLPIDEAIAPALRNHGDSANALNPGQQQTLNDALRPDKMEHVFVPKHKLDSLVSRSGGEEAAMHAIVRRIQGPGLPTRGPFEVERAMDGEIVVIRGAVVNGIPRIGTVFIR